MEKTYLADRAVIRLSPAEEGEDVRAFLQGLVTQDTSLLRGEQGGGGPLWGALLTPQGKCAFDFILWGQGNDVLLDCEAAAAEALVKRLAMYRLRRKIAIAHDDALYVHWSLEQGDGRAQDPRQSALGYRWLSDAVGDDISREYHAHRLSQGIAEGAAEMNDILWLECNAAELHGVSFTKGCYVGQENTARMNYRQKVNRRLVVVPLAQSDEKRRRVLYHDLGVSVEHRRVEDCADLSLPDWMQAAIGASSSEEMDD